mmetsp:Transcript_19815/g.59857  ORF Transcript_19815/g.59857 Transcript_19815/m.59857 type:complete len:244 (+) Transcript_19815:2375-3106(+)
MSALGLALGRTIGAVPTLLLRSLRRGRAALLVLCGESAARLCNDRRQLGIGIGGHPRGSPRSGRSGGCPVLPRTSAPVAGSSTVLTATLLLLGDSAVPPGCPGCSARCGALTTITPGAITLASLLGAICRLLASHRRSAGAVPSVALLTGLDRRRRTVALLLLPRSGAIVRRSVGALIAQLLRLLLPLCSGAVAILCTSLTALGQRLLGLLLLLLLLGIIGPLLISTVALIVPLVCHAARCVT